MTTKSVHASEPKREPHWNSRRVAIVKAMRTLGATDKDSGRTAEEIAAKAAKLGAPELGDTSEYRNTTYGIYKTRVCLDVYRVDELVHNGFVASAKHEGERGLRYYLTDKGKKTTFPAPEKKEKAPKASAPAADKGKKAPAKGKGKKATPAPKKGKKAAPAKTKGPADGTPGPNSVASLMPAIG